MPDYETEREKELKDFRRGKHSKYKKVSRDNQDRQTLYAPDDLIQRFKAFGKRHGVPEFEMLAFLKELRHVRSRQLFPTIMGIAIHHWEKKKP